MPKQFALTPNPVFGELVSQHPTRVRCRPNVIARYIKQTPTDGLLTARTLNNPSFGINMPNRFLACVHAGSQYDARGAKGKGRSKASAVGDASSGNHRYLFTHCVDDSWNK